MKFLKVQKLVVALSRLDLLAMDIGPHSRDLDGTLTTIHDIAEELLEICTVCQLRTSRKHIKQLLYAFMMQRDEIALGLIRERSEDVSKTIMLELDEPVFMVVPRDDMVYPQDTIKGFDVIEGHFPSIQTDLSQAAFLLSLRCGTASVFHLMRVMETAMKSIAAALNCPDIAGERTWNEILGKMKKAMLTEPDKRRRDRFTDYHTYLDGVRRAWRNKCMHADRLYQAEEARDIYNHVGSFMSLLAEHMDENGKDL